MEELFDKSVSDQKREEAFNQYLDYWERERGMTSEAFEIIAENLRKQIEFQEFSRYEKLVKVYFDQSRFRCLFITENIKELIGYTREDVMKYNVALLFYRLSFEHIGFPLKTTKFALNIHSKVPIDVVTQNFRIVVCGFKVKNKDGRVCRILMKYKPTTFDEKGLTQAAFVTFEDVSYLLKDDFYWGRASFGENNEFNYYFQSHQKTELAQDIISDREKEVLRLIARGMESKEIGRELFISSGTVDNHRKNMLARTGARDTTALVQLCLFCGII